MKSLFPLIMMLEVAWAHDKVNISRKQMNWFADKNGYEDSYMEFTQRWKREIIEMARDCLKEVRIRIHQCDVMSWVAENDLRQNLGLTIGRILELHRQQVDMYRRIKRIAESRFNWLRPELTMKFPDKPALQGPDAVVEPSKKYNIHPQEYNRPWVKGYKRTYNDYKPHVYIVALEYITKRETEIEHLVKLLTEFTMEAEVGRFLPNDPIGALDFWAESTAYTTSKGYLRMNTPNIRRHDAKEGKEGQMQDEEETFKAKMREEYYRKKINNNE